MYQTLTFYRAQKMKDTLEADDIGNLLVAVIEQLAFSDSGDVITCCNRNEYFGKLVADSVLEEGEGRIAVVEICDDEGCECYIRFCFGKTVDVRGLHAIDYYNAFVEAIAVPGRAFVVTSGNTCTVVKPAQLSYMH